MEIKKNFGRRLKALRLKKGLTTKQLGNAIDVSYVAICRYESNQIRPKLPKLLQLANALDTSIEYLLMGKQAKVQKRKVDLLDSDYILIRHLVKDKSELKRLHTTLKMFLSGCIRFSD